jgi:DNA-binding MarR family transcriptional regulator
MADTSHTATRWLDAREQAAWRAFLEMQARLAGQLNREMLDISGVSSGDFAVLVRLSEHPDSRMRVLELARALRWEKSRLSHQLTRMTQRGLVERSYCSEDRRGAFVVLTAQGRETVESAAPSHVESVRRYLFDQLTDDQIDTLAAISQSVVDRIAAFGESACDAALEKECEDIGD